MTRKRGFGTYICDHCNKSTVIATENAIVRCFKYQPWLSYLEFICEKCEETNYTFFGPEAWENSLHELAENTTIGFVTTPYADDHTAAEYAQVYKLTIPQARELTPRQEHYVNFFAYLLEQGVCE